MFRNRKKIEKNIWLTKHAEKKVLERQILLNDIILAIKKPHYTRKDKFDETLIHYIRQIEGKYLRVIARKEKNENILIISVFYDRRLKRRMDRDKV